MHKLSEISNEVYALLRIVVGALFLFHGVQKLFGFLAEWQPEFGSQLWMGGIIELVAGSLLVIGFQVRLAAFLASGMMAVAYFQFHWKFQFGPEFFPAINEGETAVLYCFVFLYIATRGAVKWGIDKSA
jgi:putative oxidoreductase